MIRQKILTIFFVLAFITLRAELINGPANVRIEPKREILFSLYDSVEVECTELKADWYQIGITVKVTKEHYEKHLQIKKGEKLLTIEGKLIGNALTDIPLSVCSVWTSGGAPGIPKVYGMDIYGFTFKSNIQTYSIPEYSLLILLERNKNDLKLDSFKNFLKSFHFLNEDFLKGNYPSLTEYMIYENSIDDPSPMDRIRLVFENKILIAIIHTRPLNFKSSIDNELVRGRKIIILKSPKGVNQNTFVQQCIDSYNGVD